ncbi:MAG: U32 family peptidase [Bacteroidales bacterium]|nr:U32 family peptidase [Bacteroidales bacterium]
MKSVEIMSPVGSYEALLGAMQGGADSVYFGVGKLNMRSKSANNFGLEDLVNIASFCNEHGIKSYLTVNTVIYNDEIEEMHTLVSTAKESGVSAVIASDMAVISYARSIGMEVHISTQCNISNYEAVKYYSKFADVMVTARELSLRQVAEITEYIAQNDIRGPKGELVEIEVFAHGALCMAVSGKCYLSLDNYNHSANRGECLQLCRRQYKVSDLESDIELVVDNKYIMSPKDLCTLPFIDKVLKAGVRVLKIEGRGRSAEYVKTVTRCYKEAAQAVVDGTFSKEKIENWMERLKTVYNRGFWDGYYLGRTMGEWTERYGSQATQTKIYVGKITNYFANINVAEIKMESGDMQLGDKIMIMGPTTGVYEDTLSEIRVDLKPVPQTAKGDMCSIPTSEVVRRGDKVYKVVTSIDEF